MNRDAQNAARTGGANLLAVMAHAGLPALHATVANLFGAAVYGLYSYSLGLLEIATRAATCGVDIGLLRYVAIHRSAAEDERENAALGTAIRLSFVLGIVFAALVAIFAGPLASLYRKPSIESMLRSLSPAIPFAAATVVLITATLAAKVARMNLFVRGLGEPLVLLGLALLAGFVSPTPLSLAAAHLTTAIVIGAASAVAFTRIFGRGRLRAALRAPQHWELVRFSVPMSAAEILLLVMQRADLFIVMYYFGEKATGIYAGAEFLTRAIANARYAFDYVACPVLAECHRADDRARLMYNLGLMTRWVVLLALPMATVFIAYRQEILGVFGGEFKAAAGAFAILGAAHFLNALLGLTGWVVAMTGRSRLMFVNALCASGANIGLNLWLVPRYGLEGAAWAALASVTFYRLLELGQAFWLERVHPFTFSLAKGLLAGGVALASTLALRSVLDPIGIGLVFGLGALHLAIYLAVLLILRLAPEERRLFAKVPGLRRLVGGE